MHKHSLVFPKLPVSKKIESSPICTSNRRTVNIGKLGTFWINVMSKGFENEADVSHKATKKVNVRFKPSNTIKLPMRQLKFDYLLILSLLSCAT
jgi:hypothetical protein